MRRAFRGTDKHHGAMREKLWFDDAMVVAKNKYLTLGINIHPSGRHGYGRAKDEKRPVPTDRKSCGVVSRELCRCDNAEKKQCFEVKPW